jgi:hypothetical protein
MHNLSTLSSVTTAYCDLNEERSHISENEGHFILMFV